jgi:hypothetical protein
MWINLSSLLNLSVFLYFDKVLEIINLIRGFIWLTIASHSYLDFRHWGCGGTVYNGRTRKKKPVHMMMTGKWGRKGSGSNVLLKGTLPITQLPSSRLHLWKVLTLPNSSTARLLLKRGPLGDIHDPNCRTFVNMNAFLHSSVRVIVSQSVYCVLLCAFANLNTVKNNIDWNFVLVQSYSEEKDKQ